MARGGLFETESIQAIINILKKEVNTPLADQILDTISDFVKNSIQFYEIVVSDVLDELEANGIFLSDELMEELKDITSKETITVLEIKPTEEKEVN